MLDAMRRPQIIAAAHQWPPPPRRTSRCSSWTKRLITAHDHAAVQINIGDVDPSTGRYLGTFKTFALCGYIRDKVSAVF